MLRGRDDELAVINALLSGLPSGHSGALVIRGEPGIGKTALLQHAADAAGRFRVLRSAGIEAEMHLPYAALHLLLGSLLDRVGTLPGPQCAALRAVFGQGTVEPDGRFLVGLAVLTLLGEAATEDPVLCLVDDAQLLDDASAETLLFVARRVRAEGLGLVFAVREDPGHPFPADGLPVIRLGGLDTATASALLLQRRGSLTAAARGTVLAAAAGNPLALIELDPDTSSAPLTQRLRETFLDQVRGLPEPAQRLLLIVAAEGCRDLGVVLAAARTLGLAATDLEPAERVGLLRVTGVEVMFRHPLVGTAVYQGATLTQRVVTHRALAAVLTDARDVDRRAWQLANAATGTDEHLAAELERTAVRAVQRNGLEGAAAAYRQAARLSPDLEDRARRLTLTGEAAVETAHLDEARTVAEQAAVLTRDPALQARTARVRATAEFKQGRPRAAHALLTEGARHVAGTDPHLELRMQLTAVNAAWSADDLGLLATTANRLAGLQLAADDPMTPIRTFLIWMTSLALDRTGTQWPPLGRVVREARESSIGCPHDLTLIGIGGLIAGHERETRDVAAAVAAESRLRGRLGWLTAMLSLGAAAQVLLGEHRESRVGALEALQLASDTGQTRWIGYTRGILAYLAAVAGDETGCRALAAEALDSPVNSFTPPGGSWAHWALALLDLGAGRPRAAVDRLDLSAAGPARLDPPLVHSIPDAIEAWVRLGQAAQAAIALSRLERWASHIDQASVNALVRRCQALLAGDAAAEDHYRAALELHELDPRPFERARTALLYGEWLRRRRRKADARPLLSQALGAFEELGALFWVRRAAAELGATRSRPSPGPAAGAGLTPQEFQVGRLAAEGLSNRDIAAQLFLSPRTVGYHLNKAYHKLGVTSRAELAGLPLGDPTVG